jgi:hypothetical protein
VKAGREQGAIKATRNHGWIARSNKGITMLGAGRKILNGGHRRWREGQIL